MTFCFGELENIELNTGGLGLGGGLGENSDGLLGVGLGGGLGENSDGLLGVGLGDGLDNELRDEGLVILGEVDGLTIEELDKVITLGDFKTMLGLFELELKALLDGLDLGDTELKLILTALLDFAV